jgi:hypothetical protein
VPIETLYFVPGASGGSSDWLAMMGSKGKPKSKAELQKLAVADYFISELYLCAEMCLDRNYIGMQKIEPLFPYEVIFIRNFHVLYHFLLIYMCKLHWNRRRLWRC